MSAIQSRFIDAYRILSWPARQLRLRHLKRTGQVPVSIVFYHRVDDRDSNPWTISNEGFTEQIDWMQNNFDLVNLEECQRRIRSGHNDRPTLSITFDDGYADNCLNALPMLIERNIPVTYFVTTRHTFHGQPFPHDVEAGKPLPPNNIESLRALAAAGVEIGGHTRTHADLGDIQDPQVLFDEVIVASQEMEKAIGKRVRYFAFPFGQAEHLNRDAFDLLHEYGFEGVCSAYGGYNAIGGDGFHLQRIHGDPNFARMKNWLTFDPRLGCKPKFEYSRPAESEPVAKASPSVTRENAVVQTR